MQGRIAGSIVVLVLRTLAGVHAGHAVVVPAMCGMGCLWQQQCTLRITQTAWADRGITTGLGHVAGCKRHANRHRKQRQPSKSAQAESSAQ